MVTYVNNLGLSEIATGDSAGNWGVLTNTSLELIGEALGYATEQSFGSDANATSAVDDGATSPVRSIYFKVTSAGSLTATRQLLITPDTIKRLMFIENATTGSQSITIKQGSGAGAAVTIPNGDTKAVILPGSGTGSIVLDAFASLSVVDLKVQDDLTVTDDMTVGGTLGVTGIATFTDDIIIGDGKTIGSASDVDAMSISSGGVVNFSARPTFAASLTIQDGGSIGSASDLNAVTISSGGVVAVTATTASTSSTTGALTVGGGVGIADDLYVGTDFDVTGNTVLDGTLTVTGGALLNGTTPTLTIGDAGAEDAKIVFDGNAADYHVGLDDSEDALQIGLGSALGTTPRITIRAAEVVVNDLGIDLDFRVESDGNANMLLVDGGDNVVLIGGATNSAGGMALKIGDSGNDGEIGFSADGDNSYITSYDRTNSSYHPLILSASNIIITNTGGTLYTDTAGGTTNLRLGLNAGDSIADGALRNTVVGGEAGTALTVGDDNVAVGYAALDKGTNERRNVAVGAYALTEQLDAGLAYNVAVGYTAGAAVTTGVQNTLIGGLAGDALTTGGANTVVGYGALGGEDANSGSTAIGHSALAVQNVATPNAYNTALGHSAGVLVSTGYHNTLLGGYAGDNITSGDSNIIIGYGIDAASATADNQLNIGGWITGAAGAITIPNKLTVSAADGVRDADYVAAFTNLEATASRNFGVTIQAGTNGSDIAVNVVNLAADTTLLRVHGNGTTTIANTLTLTDGNLVVADGHGIDFSAADSGLSSTSNLLDDYEEGTFTMGFTGASISLGSAVGAYTKIGRVVTWSYYSESSDISSASGSAAFTGLPFTVLNSASAYSPINIAYNTFFGGSTTAGTQGYSHRNSTTGALNIAGGTATSTFVDGTGKYIMMSGTYITSA